MPSTYTIDGPVRWHRTPATSRSKGKGGISASPCPKNLRARFISEGRRGKNGRRHPGQPLRKIVVSLHTQSLREAQERRWPLVQEWRQKLERARTEAPFALAEIEAFARESYGAALAR